MSKHKIVSENIPLHIYQMEAILDTAQQKMDALEQRIADYKQYQAKIKYGEYKGWWEFPGGKIEDGETPKQALIREIREVMIKRIKSRQSKPASAMVKWLRALLILQPADSKRSC